MSRNFLFFIVPFLIVIAYGLVTGCSMPLRKPEPYEQRTASVDRETDYDWDAKKRENAAWWRCLDNHRADEC